MSKSDAETLLAVQLDQAHIFYEREYHFHDERKWRADFMVPASLGSPFDADVVSSPLLVEIDGGGYVQGRHSRGAGIEGDCEKQSAAAILGYRVIRVTPAQVNEGRALSWIQQALGLAKRDAA